MKNNDLRELMVFLFIILLVIIVFSFALFSFTGIRVVFGIIFISFPFYLILNNFELNQGEKFVFSVLMGLTLFSSLVYILGLVISFRISIFVVFVFLIAAAFIIKRFWKT